MKKIIVPDPKKRITINEIKKHPFYIKGKQLFDQEFTIQYLNDENNSEKTVMTTAKPNTPTTNIERGMSACWMVLSIKSMLNVMIALGM